MLMPGRNVEGACVCAKSLQSCPTLCDPMGCSPQVPLFMKFSRHKYQSELRLPSPGDLPDPGIEAGSPKFRADSSPTEPQGKHWCTLVVSKEWSDLLYLANILTKEGSSILSSSFILQPGINKPIKLNSRLSQRTFFCCWFFFPILLIIIPCLFFVFLFFFSLSHLSFKTEMESKQVATVILNITAIFLDFTSYILCG